jgi:hypothetical protein
VLRRPAVLALAGSLAGTLAWCVLAGCGGDGKPTSDPAPSPASPSSSPTPTGAPTMPAAATAHTKAGAIAFARHYVDLINYAQATGDIDSLALVEGAKCESCKSVRQNLSSLYASGGWIRGGELAVVSADALSNAESHAFNVDLEVKTAPETVKDRSGKVSKIAGGTNVLTVFLKRVPSGWKVAQWTRAE